MKEDWKSIEVFDACGLDETLQACRKQLLQKENRIEHKEMRIFWSYLKADGNKIIIGYLLFLLAFLCLIFTNYFKLSILSLYYGALGVYFTTMLYRHQESGLNEILYTTPINGAKLFLFQIACFLTLYFITILLLFTCTSISDYVKVIEIIATSMLPLSLSQCVLMSAIFPIRSYQVALSIYTLLYGCFVVTFTNIAEVSSYNILPSSWVETLLQYQPLLCMIASVLFIVSCIWIYHRLGKEGFYEIND